jgi:hypothetical protein
MRDKNNRPRDTRRPAQPPLPSSHDDDLVGRLETLASALDGASAEAEAIARKVREDLLTEELRYLLTASADSRKPSH